MSADTVVLRGTLKADGTLELAGAVTLRPGPVEVTVRAIPATSVEDVLTLLARIRTEQQASGHVPRTREDIDAAVRQMRDEWEEHQLSIERLQKEGRHRREATSSTEPSA